MSSSSRPTIDDAQFAESKAQKCLRITCYGSSSAETPLRYMEAAKTLGYILGKRGHVCVNGAGSFGCMAAMNDGVALAEGHVVGVIHSMWLKSSSSTEHGDPYEVGAHPVFGSLENAGASTAPSTTNATTTTTSSTKTKSTFIRELIVASGDDLQERKRLLVDKADALVVLPGGPGTWDELWEMACAKGIGMSNIPIVCINCDDYYAPFQDMLLRAYDEGLMKHLPEDLVYFVDTPEEAVRWVEAMTLNEAKSNRMNIRKATSFFHDPLSRRSKRRQPATNVCRVTTTIAFATGAIGGALLTTSIFALRQLRR